MKWIFRIRKMKLLSICFALAVFFCGCSSSYKVSSTAGRRNFSYSEMNDELNERNVKIELNDGEKISGKNVTVSDDSVSWINTRTTNISKVATRQIRRIYFKNHIIGALEGLGMTAPVFFAGSWAIGGFSSKGIGGSQGWELPAALGGIGGGVGLIIGGIIGHSYNYKFPTTEQSDSLQIRKTP